jgi:hypothetical protein
MGAPECSFLFNISCAFSIPFILPRTKARLRIGPHNWDVFALIFGALLGDGTAEQIPGGGTRIRFQQESTHSGFLLWLHSFFATRGYCSTLLPNLSSRLGLNGVTRYFMRFSTFSFTSFNWFYTAFYPNGIKIIPRNLADYFTPLSLAVLIMDDGTKCSSGLRFCLLIVPYIFCYAYFTPFFTSYPILNVLYILFICLFYPAFSAYREFTKIYTLLNPGTFLYDYPNF